MLLLAGPCHVSADQLLQSLRQSGSRISKATVYNTLNVLSRAGIIREVSVHPSRLVYDSTRTAHHHFLNEDTGELVDIDPADVELRRLPRLPAGTQATGVEVIIRVRRR
jgi:Fur family iron response transcriptional regulator